MNIRKYFWLLGLLSVILLGLNTACSDDEFYTNDRGSSIIIQKDFKVSEFFLESDYWNIPDTVTNIQVYLQSLTDNSEKNFDVEIKRDNNGRIFRLMIPKSEKIVDSDYIMKGFLSNGRSLGQCFKVTFKDEMLGNVLSVSVVYELNGAGTEDEPYLIENKDDFKKFSDILQNDETGASGIYFKQTTNLEGVEGNLHAFAGVYNGDFHKIYYVCSGVYDNVGLFSVLNSGAEIKNMNLSVALENV